MESAAPKHPQLVELSLSASAGPLSKGAAEAAGLLPLFAAFQCARSKVGIESGGVRPGEGCSAPHPPLSLFPTGVTL